LDFTAGSLRQNEHAFFSDVTTMKELENDLTDLLQRFREGTLLAFSKQKKERSFLLLNSLGPQFTCTKMDTIRETQEQLAKLHFSLDKDLSTIKSELRFLSIVLTYLCFIISIESDECQKKANENMSCLMQKVNQLQPKISSNISNFIWILVTKIN